MTSNPELSVVIPTLNEKANVTQLVDALIAQQGVPVEIIVVDGGSSDGTDDALQRRVAETPGLSLRQSGRGRAVQLNLGAAAAKAPFLLFLHADTTIDDRDLLANGLRHLKEKLGHDNTSRVAGHFGLRFARTLKDASDSAYFFYEAKSHLDREECINGDQGMLIPMQFFEEIGGFDESLAYLEELRISRRIAQLGEWTNLPGIVWTSARRFELEGLATRQTLNSFIKCFDNIGFTQFFSEAHEAYREQGHSGRLTLRPFTRLALRLQSRDGARGFIRWWYLIGHYINCNAWQLAFAMDCRNANDPARVSRVWVKRYESSLRWLLESPPLSAVTGLIALIWVGVISLFGR